MTQQIGPGGGRYWARRWITTVPEPRRQTARSASVELAEQRTKLASILALIYLGDQLGQIANALNRRRR